MQTVIETSQFLKAAAGAGMTDSERSEFIDYIARNSQAGDMIKGSNGYRKVRWAGKGKGKSGGYRVITFYSGAAIPVFLITVYAKGDADDLTGAQVNAMAAASKQLVEGYAGTRGKKKK